MPELASALSTSARHWRRLFSIGGTVLAVVLTGLVAFHPSGTELHTCYAIGGASGLLCAYAAARLRDVERTLATMDANRLLDDVGIDDIDGLDN